MEYVSNFPVRSYVKENNIHEDLELVATGLLFDLFMTKKVKKSFDNASAKDRARCKKWFTKFAKEGNRHLNDSQCRNEGKFHTGGKQGKYVSVYAFKSNQLRVYGAQVPNTRLFICAEIELSKKKGSANQDKLNRAATNLVKFWPIENLGIGNDRTKKC